MFAADGVGELTGPVDGLHADRVGEVLGQAGVETAGLGPVARHRDGGGEGGVVEAERDRYGLDSRSEGASAAGLGLDLGGLGGGALLDGGAETAQGVLRAADDHATRAVDRGHRGGVAVLGDLGDEVADLGEGGAADGEHGGVLAVRHEAGTAADDRGSGTDEAGDRHQLDIARGGTFTPAGEGGDADDALRVADGGDRSDAGEVHALVREQVHGRELGEQHARHAERGADRVGAAGGEVVGEPHVRLERARQRGGQLAGDGSHQAGGLLHQVGHPGGVGVLAGELGEGREPVGALSAEGHGELFTLSQAVGQ